MTRKGTTESFSLALNIFLPFKLMNLTFCYKVYTKVKLLKYKSGFLSSKIAQKEGTVEILESSEFDVMIIIQIPAPLLFY